jgi:hypothetical protein
MWLANLGSQLMLGQRRSHSRYQIRPVRFVIEVLKLAAATLRKVTARRLLVMRTFDECPVLQQLIARNPERDMAA